MEDVNWFVWFTQRVNERTGVVTERGEWVVFA